MAHIQRPRQCFGVLVPFQRTFPAGKPQTLQTLYLKSSPTFSASASAQPMVCSSLPMLFCFQITPGGKPLIITGSVPVPRLFCKFSQSASPPMFWCSGAVSTNFSGRQAANPPNLLPEGSPTFSASASAQPMVCSSLPMLFCFQITPGGKPLIITGSVPVPRLFCNLGQSASLPMFWCSGAVSTSFSGRKAANPTNPLPKEFANVFRVSLNPTRLPLPHISRVATDDPGRLEAVLCADHDASGSSRTVI